MLFLKQLRQTTFRLKKETSIEKIINAKAQKKNKNKIPIKKLKTKEKTNIYIYIYIIYNAYNIFDIYIYNIYI